MKIRYQNLLTLILFILFFSGKDLQAKTILAQSDAQAEAVTQKPKVIYSISTPRSLSTAFLRMMYARGDFQIFNEPGLLTYFYLHNPNKTFALWETVTKSCSEVKSKLLWETIAKSYSELKNKLLSQIDGQRDVFIKELGYTAYNYLTPESELLKNQEYHIIFLIRNLHHTLMSFAKKTENDFEEGLINRTNIPDCMSYRKLYELYQKFKQHSPQQSSIMLAEELVTNPHKTIANFCQKVRIYFKQESLSWERLADDFSFEKEWNWLCPIPKQIAHYWYDKTISSTGFTQEYLPKYAVDEQGQPTFEEIENSEYRAFYKKLYDENLPYYKLFVDEYNKANPPKPKVIYSISTPRSLSTVFLRMMYARGDFEILNELGVQAYCSLYLPKNFGSTLKTFQDVEKTILQKSIDHKNIFVKDMAFAAEHYLIPENDFLNQQDYHVVFLIRNPHHVLISFYKKSNVYDKTTLTPDRLKDLLSYKKLYELFTKLQQKGTNQPFVILSEELAANPRKVVTQFCQQVKIPFKEESLSWNKLDGNFPFEQEWNWNFTESTDMALHWFDKAIASTSFTSDNLPSYAVDEHGQPTFEEIENPKHRAFHKMLYEENMPYYKLLVDAYNKSQ